MIDVQEIIRDQAIRLRTPLACPQIDLLEAAGISNHINGTEGHGRFRQQGMQGPRHG